MKLGKFLKNKLEAKHIYSVVMVLLYIYLISRCIYQYASGIGIDGCKVEFLLMTLFSLVIYAFSFLEFDFFNKSRDKKKKKLLNNVKRNSLFEAGFLSLIFTTFIYLLIAYEVIYVDFYNMIPNHEILSIIGLAILLFLIFFIIIYFVLERFLKPKFAKLK